MAELQILTHATRKSRGHYKGIGWEGQLLGRQGREHLPEEVMFGSRPEGGKEVSPVERWGGKNKHRGLLSGEEIEPSRSRTKHTWLSVLWSNLYFFKVAAAATWVMG